MNINYTRNWSGKTLIIEGKTDVNGATENVRILQDAEERTWEGSKCVNRDVSTDALETLSFALGEMIYDRKADFNSQDLIEVLFEKLPADIACNLAIKLSNEYIKTQDKWHTNITASTETSGYHLRQHKANFLNSKNTIIKSVNYDSLNLHRNSRFKPLKKRA